MTNILIKTLRSSFFILAFSLILNANIASAQNCATPPTCEQLGYILAENDCKDTFSLKCPFNTSKVYCSVKCRVGFYAYSDGTCYEASNPDKSFIGIVLDAAERTVWNPGSAFTGIAGVNIATWQEAPALCESFLPGTHLGSKEELETWASYFPASKGVAPTIKHTVWTRSENDADTAWAYAVEIGKGIVAKGAKPKDSKFGVFCVKNF